jgi:exo-beta-1,3-glucanase (GH17 family)
MRAILPFFIGVVVAIVASWWWLGLPVAIKTAADGAKPYCVSYSPFRGNQTPFDLSTKIDPRQIEEDLQQLMQITDCVRTYSTDFGLDRVAEVASRHQMKVIQGAWLGFDPIRNDREIATVVALSKRFPDTIRAIVIGNESLLRGEISPADLSNLIRAVKAKVTAPVTYADVWEFWLRYREVYDAVDFVTIHVLPYWEDMPIAARFATAHLADVRRKLALAFPAKEILVGEVGWPSNGRMRAGALPSPINQARVISEVLAFAKRDNFRVNVIEAFDQPWKRQLEGTVGGHWGLLDGQSREPKFTAGTPVSNHPGWLLNAAVGVVLATLVFLAAFASLRGQSPAKAPSLGRLIALTACALVPGVLFGWALENVLVESLGLGGWSRSLITAAIAALAPILSGAAVMERTSLPTFAQVLAHSAARPGNLLAFALGLLLAAVGVLALESALGLVFDPRYRDFPFASLSAAAFPFFLLAVIADGPRGQRGLAETVMAAALAGSAVYVALNESFANWQALWLCAVFFGIAISLTRVRVARD